MAKQLDRGRRGREPRSGGPIDIRNAQRNRLVKIRDDAKLRALLSDSGTGRAAKAFLQAAITWLDQHPRQLDRDGFHTATTRLPGITVEDWEAGKQLASELSDGLI